jgi:hypothetical protein
MKLTQAKEAHPKLRRVRRHLPTSFLGRHLVYTQYKTTGETFPINNTHEKGKQKKKKKEKS